MENVESIEKMRDIRKEEAISQIREFNRFYTVLLGFLNKNYLESGYSVTETRILFEIYRNEYITANYLIELLVLDKSYMSRLIRGFEQKGLIVRETASDDARKRVIQLTKKGREEIERLISITNTKIFELIAPLDTKKCAEVCEAMQVIMEHFAPMYRENKTYKLD